MSKFIETNKIFKRKEFIDYMYNLYKDEFTPLEENHVLMVVEDMLIDCADIMAEEHADNE